MKSHKPCLLLKNEFLPDGLDIFGFFLSEIGLGQSARLYHAAAASQNISVTAVNRSLPGREAEPAFQGLLSRHGRHRIGLNIAGLVAFRKISREICSQRRNIALPLWELDTVSAHRIKSLRGFETLWAPSNFIKESLERSTNRPVALVRHPLHITTSTMPERDPANPLRILFFFDFDSFSTRKNPEGAVKAFQLAFHRNEDVLLTIKTRGGSDVGRRSWLLHQASLDSRIRVIDETLPYEEIRSLLEQHDVFLSLHRSEGFGLGCAEALALGKIVVSTDYGGTRDFISEATGFPVSYKTVPVGEGEYIDAKGAVWAEPSIEHAAQRLREIYDTPEMAWEKARKGRQHLSRHHSVEVVGARLRDLLETEGAFIA
jgi:glycosyltransferase involved in cell wall biosynthesis